jgi:hypothetical protein
MLYSTRSCIIWAFFGTRGPLKLSFHSSFKLAYSCQKKPKLHANSLNKLLLLHSTVRIKYVVQFATVQTGQRAQYLAISISAQATTCGEVEGSFGSRPRKQLADLA